MKIPTRYVLAISASFLATLAPIAASVSYADQVTCGQNTACFKICFDEWGACLDAARPLPGSVYDKNSAFYKADEACGARSNVCQSGLMNPNNTPTYSTPPATSPKPDVSPQQTQPTAVTPPAVEPGPNCEHYIHCVANAKQAYPDIVGRDSQNRALAACAMGNPGCGPLSGTATPAAVTPKEMLPVPSSLQKSKTTVAPPPAVQETQPKPVSTPTKSPGSKTSPPRQNIESPNSSVKTDESVPDASGSCSGANRFKSSTGSSCLCVSGYFENENSKCEAATLTKQVSLSGESALTAERELAKIKKDGGITTLELKDRAGSNTKAIAAYGASDGTTYYSADGEHFYGSLREAFSPSVFERTRHIVNGVSEIIGGIKDWFWTTREKDPDREEIRKISSTMLSELDNDMKNKDRLSQYAPYLLHLGKKIATDKAGDASFAVQSVEALAQGLSADRFAQAARIYIAERQGGKTAKDIAHSPPPELSVSELPNQSDAAYLFYARLEDTYSRFSAWQKIKGGKN